jgi:ribosomal protein S27AE
LNTNNFEIASNYRNLPDSVDKLDQIEWEKREQFQGIFIKMNLKILASDRQKNFNFTKPESKSSTKYYKAKTEKDEEESQNVSRYSGWTAGFPMADHEDQRWPEIGRVDVK